MKLKKFFKECRDKEVFKNLSIYIVSSWVLLQVVSLVAEPLNFPKKTLSYALILLLIGFPVYIYFVWKFQLVNTVKKKPLLDSDGLPVPGKYSKNSFKKLYFASLSLIGLLSFSAVLYIIQKNFTQNSSLSDFTVGDKIAVLVFDNNTNSNDYEIAGKMAADWIIHGITQNKVGQVISPKIIEDYSEVLKASFIPSNNKNILTDYLKPSKIIKGEYYLNNNRLLFQCSITDEVMNETLISLKPVECDPNAPLDCIEELKQRILGYLITENDISLNLQETPPKYEAYQYLLQAKNLQYKNDKEHLRLLDRAIAADSTFFEPKTYKLVYYYNAGNYVVADSLLRDLLVSTVSNNRQRNFYNLYEALLLGNNKNVFRYYQKEYNYAPLDMETNSSMMSVALQFVNKPMVIDSIYQEIDMKGMDLLNCNYCEDRYYIKALADIEFQKYRKAIDLLSPFRKEQGFEKLKRVLIRAHNKQGNYATTDQILSEIQITSTESKWLEMFLFNAKDLLVEGKINMANIYFDKIINAVKQTPDTIKTNIKKTFAESLFFKGEYESAELILQEVLNVQSELIEQNAMLAITYQRNGKTIKAQEQLAKLENLRGEYQYGSVDYGLAQYYAAIENEEKTINYLIRAVAAGRWYDPVSFQNDPLFKPYFQSEAFKRVMNFSY
jgi:hypothetical protein